MTGSGPQDLYAVLGVASDATAETIRHAYRELARRLHPDVDPGGGEAFRTVSAAYEVLGDERSRAAYDQRRAAARGRAIPGPAAERRAPAPTGNVGPTPMPRRVVSPAGPRPAHHAEPADTATMKPVDAADEWRSLTALFKWVVAAIVAALIVITLLAVAEAGNPAAPAPTGSSVACRTPVGSADCRAPDTLIP